MMALNRLRPASSLAGRLLSSGQQHDEVDVAIIGGGIIGAAVAHHVVKEQGKTALLVTRDPLLSVTSSVSTECFRGYWGTDAIMTEFVGVDSIGQIRRLVGDDNPFALQERGYLYVTKSPAVLDSFNQKSERARSQLGSQAAKGLRKPLVFGTSEALRQRYPFLGDDVVGGILVEDAGWLSAHALGSTLIEGASATGRLSIVRNAVAKSVGVGRQNEVTELAYATTGDQPQARTVKCKAVVNASGPWINAVHRQLFSSAAQQLNVVNELHGKVLINDRDVRALPATSDVPMVIGLDETDMQYTDDERSYLQESESPYAKTLLAAGGRLPAGVHCRPSSCGSTIMLIWEFFFRQQEKRTRETPPEWPIAEDVFDPLYVELCIRGMSSYIPSFARHLGRKYLAVDGGWYCKTPDARPLIGTPEGAPEGYVVAGGVSGVGIMSSLATGRLAMQHALRKADLASPITQALLPSRIMGPPQYTGIADARS